MTVNGHTLPSTEDGYGLLSPSQALVTWARLGPVRVLQVLGRPDRGGS